jgi:hypothetical protein
VVAGDDSVRSRRWTRCSFTCPIQSSFGEAVDHGLAVVADDSVENSSASHRERK